MIITDIDPIISARSIPLVLIPNIIMSVNNAYNLALTTGYNKIIQVEPLHKLVHADITYSSQNFNWYIKFYDELNDIIHVSGINIDIPNILLDISKIKKHTSFNINPLELHSPAMDIFYQDLLNTFPEVYTKAKDIFILSKIILLGMSPSFDDFVKGVPIWMINTSDTILQAYDAFSRRHIKITKENNEYHYYTSVISDNWKEITSVPSEMKIIIDYIISNRANLALTNES